MKLATRWAVTLALSTFVVGTAAAADITGAGATFPYPLYAKWAEAYKAKTNNNLNYQSIGSGGGIKQIQAKTVDFGASDMPLKPEELDKSGLTQFPTVIGGVVPVVNLPGVTAGQLKLTGALIADIYLGKISNWNDAAIAKLNPGVKLPDQKITVVRRSDGSGTTFVFTNYLSKVSPEWSSAIGSNTAVNWKTGVGGKGNEGVANYVTRIKGAIGYVEYAYAKQNKIAHAAVQNAAGTFVQPSDSTFKAAASGADWAKTKDFYLILTNQPGKDSWPIASATFILMHKKQDKPEQATEALKFFDWAYANGDATANQLDYVPMPTNVKSLIHTSWKQITNASGTPVWK
ncbi:phosphate ABC transporter substrate-binding protein PstS [Vogesella sp. LIG4]|uniref:phosphate ABC transporter substrate-binding protein PstS n=1 Tax=Vogesella sp. LIG4 TaxID=1192162 RepID=UPI00081FB999|nr:phosphate ABC transporter substrate-binding protein PstS [Vogesella sp. LIG4]SCK08305.1 phosphate transport system substrate-binding protein [Vogesella sp. LIG4]